MDREIAMRASRNPLQDKLFDELAIDLDVLDLIARAHTLLRSRQPGRIAIAKAIPTAKQIAQQAAAPLPSRKSAA